MRPYYESLVRVFTIVSEMSECCGLIYFTCYSFIAEVTRWRIRDNVRDARLFLTVHTASRGFSATAEQLLVYQSVAPAEC